MASKTPDNRGAAPRLDGGNVAWLTLSLALAIAPHAVRLPLWEFMLCGALFLWRLHIARRGLALPRAGWRLLLAAIAAAGVLASYGTLVGRDAGVALLIVLISLKLLELATLRDAMLLAFLGYFVVITSFFYSQSIPIGLYMLGVVLLLTMTLIGFNHSSGHMQAGQRARLAGALLAQAFPLMLVLFILFPRVPGPLWGLPQEGAGALSGLSESMNPGSISRLGLSDAVAFRASFEGRVPQVSRLYWRGPVFWHFDGTTWTAGGPRRFAPPSVQPEGEPLGYTVTLEPHGKTWLFAVDMPVALPRQSGLTGDLQLVSRAPVRERMRYSVSSSTRFRAGADESIAQLDRALQLPSEGNARARGLAAGWRASHPDPRDRVRAALDFFRTRNYTYTLTPPALGPEPVDEFLFETRRGFCEHYASAFVFLMRVAGVPARVVTGYLGGELNPLGGYLIVRQADAHAWAEVWLQGEGWVRVDPTAAVAPQRIESGIASALPLTDPLPGLVRPDSEWLRQVRLTWDALANNWNQWVLGYGPERQVQLLSLAGLGMPDWRAMAAALAAGTGLLLLAAALWLTWRARPTARDRVQQAWLAFCRKLARRGLRRSPSEGPLDYAQRVVRARPDLAAPVAAIAAAYVRLRYGRGDGPSGVRELAQMVRRLKV